MAEALESGAVHCKDGGLIPRSFCPHEEESSSEISNLKLLEMVQVGKWDPEM